MNDKIMDRGIIKWQPFNSCFNPDLVIEALNKERDKINYPTLSEDQLNVLEFKIKEAFELQIFVNIEYYYAGKIQNIAGQIIGFNINKNKILINNQEIYFKQILKISY